MLNKSDSKVARGTKKVSGNPSCMAVVNVESVLVSFLRELVLAYRAFVVLLVEHLLERGWRKSIESLFNCGICMSLLYRTVGAVVILCRLRTTEHLEAQLTLCLPLVVWTPSALWHYIAFPGWRAAASRGCTPWPESNADITAPLPFLFVPGIVRRGFGSEGGLYE